MTKVTEAREFTRSPVRIRAEIRLASGVLVEGQARNVSLNGLLFATERALPIGHEVRVSLILDTGTCEHRIESAGHVARVEDQGVAIAFRHVNAECLEHLRQLVLYNAEDAERVEEEFASHVGLHRKGG